MDREEYRRTSLEMWERMASGWERRSSDIDEATEPVREWLLRELAPQPGDTILELAAGPGDTGLAAAALLGDEGRLISTDFSAEMVEVARRRGAELGLRNAEFRAMDAEHLDLEDDSVDAAICRFGYMLMADPAAALAETRRVLRPGGRLVVAVWTTPEQNPWVALPGRVLLERGHVPPPEPGAPGIFSLGSEDRLRALLEVAGFGDVRIEEVGVRFVYRDVDDYVALASDTAGSFARAFGESPEEERVALKHEIAAAFEPYSVDGGYELPGTTLLAVAT